MTVVWPPDVDGTLVRLCERLEDVISDIREASARAAEAEVQYRTAYARALLHADGKTAAAREAAAVMAVSDDLLRYRLANARLVSAQETGRILRAQLDAWRTINANMRQSQL